MSKPKLLLIIPAHNEELNIGRTIDIVKKSNFDYIVIDDGSTDKTVDILNKNNANFISLSFNLGIGGAVQTGYKYARNNGYDIAIQFDADCQHDIDCVNQLIQPILDKKANFVIGSRFISKDTSKFKSSYLRRIGIRLISNIIFLFSKKRIYDTTSGFRAADKSTINYFAEHYPQEYPEPVSDYELIKQGYIVTEIPARMHERTAGKSSIHSWKSAYYVINVILSIIALSLRKKHHE